MLSNEEQAYGLSKYRFMLVRRYYVVSLGVMYFADSRTGLMDSRTELEIAFKQ